MASLARSTKLIAMLGLQTINLLLANRSFLQLDWLVRHTLKVTILPGLWKQKFSYISLLEQYFLLNDIPVCICVYTFIAPLLFSTMHEDQMQQKTAADHH